MTIAPSGLYVEPHRHLRRDDIVKDADYGRVGGSKGGRRARRRLSLRKRRRAGCRLRWLRLPPLMRPVRSRRRGGGRSRCRCGSRCRCRSRCWSRSGRRGERLEQHLDRIVRYVEGYILSGGGGGNSLTRIQVEESRDGHTVGDGNRDRSGGRLGHCAPGRACRRIAALPYSKQFRVGGIPRTRADQMDRIEGKAAAIADDRRQGRQGISGDWGLADLGEIRG